MVLSAKEDNTDKKKKKYHKKETLLKVGEIMCGYGLQLSQ